MSISNLAPVPELYVPFDTAEAEKVRAADLPSIDLKPRHICDLELLMNGGFYPLNGFLNKTDYDGVVENMRMASGALWPMPITLDVTEDIAANIEEGQEIALRDQEGVIWPDLSGRHNQRHPATSSLRLPRTPRFAQ